MTLPLIKLSDHKILSKGESLQVLKDTKLIERGQISHRLYILKKGTLIIRNDQGQEVTFSQADSILGWESCFFEEPYLYDIIAGTHCTINVLNKTDINAILISNTEDIKRLSFHSFRTSWEILALFNAFDKNNLLENRKNPPAVKDSSVIDYNDELFSFFINNFIKYTPEMINTQISTALAVLGAYTECDHIIWYKVSHHKKELSPKYSWSAYIDANNKFCDKRHKFNNIPYILDRLLSNNEVVINDCNADFSNYPEDLNYAKEHSLSSLFMLPIFENEKLSTVVLFHHQNKGHKWRSITLERIRFLISILNSHLLHVARKDKSDLQPPYDQQTGFANRHIFLEKLEHYIGIASRGKNKIALLFVHIESNIGAQISSDLVFQYLSGKLKNIVRAADTIGRLHENQFVIVLNQLDDKNDARIFTNRLIDQIEQPLSLNSKEIHFYPSIGISVFPDNAKTAHDLLDASEQAMYSARNLTGNTFVFAHQNNPSALPKDEYEQLEYELKEAFQNKQIVNYYQPIIELKTNKVIGAEVLARWKRNDETIILPSEFLSVYEKSGLIVNLSETILDSACATLQKWQKRIPTFKLSINVSMRWLIDPSFTKIVSKAISKYKLNPENLTIELTEGIILRDIDNAQKTLKKLKDIGVKLCLDDFGTGYSSLSFVHQFPIDIIKIDKSFIASISNSKDHAPIVKSLIRLSEEFKIDLIAEGIETKEQKAFLVQNQCLYGQGFLFAHPMPEENFNNLLGQDGAES